MEERLARLTKAMIHYDHGDTLRIQHFIKVHGFAATIGTLEGLDKKTQDILEAAAVLHDIGIHPSEEKYGSSMGKYQEELGPAEADKLMREVGGYSEEEIERVKYLIAHHHTYYNIEGIDYRILVEADFLVNFYESGSTPEARASVREKIFATETGRQMLDDMF